MPPIYCSSRSFQNVYLLRSTGGYYTRARWPVSPKKADHELVGGKPSFLLAPVFRLFRIDGDDITRHQEVFEFPKPGGHKKISVGLEEIEFYFDFLPEYKAVQNSSLDVLLAEYEHERSSGQPNNLAKMAHRYALTMEDSQARCLLELMARVLDETFAAQDAIIPLAGDEEDVVK